MSASQRITARRSEGPAPALPTLPELSSAQRHWSGIIFERHSVEPGHLPQHSLAEHCFLLPVGQRAVPYRCTLDGRRVSGEMVPERIQFRAAGTTVSTTWTALLDGIFVAISPQALARSVGDDAHEHGVGLASDLHPRDNPVLRHLTLALDAHLRSGAVRGRLFEQSLLDAMCANVILSYGHEGGARGRRAAMSQFTLRRVHEFIHSHLGSQFAIEDIAAAACMSPYHLGHVYRQTTGQSLWQYVLQSRAALARELIGRHPGHSLAHIAMLSGFESYSQFIAVFRKYWGVAPGQYRRMLH